VLKKKNPVFPMQKIAVRRKGGYLGEKTGKERAGANIKNLCAGSGGGGKEKTRAMKEYGGGPRRTHWQRRVGTKEKKKRQPSSKELFY